MEFLLTIKNLLCFMALICPAISKHYEKCELASELIKLGMPQDQLNDWLCLVEGESQYNSSAVGSLNWDGSIDHGLFQISEKFWCNGQFGPKPLGCNIPCSALLDDSIADDVECVKKIHQEWQSMKGNGFLAWVAWRSKCQGKDLSSYSSDCTKLIAKQVPNAIEEPQSPTSQYAFTLNEDSQTYENIANSNDTPMSLKDIVLSQGGKDLQSLWQKFFGTKK